MRRRTLRILLIAVVAVAIVIAAVRLATNVTVGDVIDAAALRDEALPDLLQRIRDFHRVVTRNGVKLLEVSAKEASYYRDTAAIEIVEPTVTFFDAGRKVGQIAGGKGQLLLDGTKVTSVSLVGGVELSFEQFRIDAEAVSYDRAGKLITTSGPATLSSDEFVVHGRGLTVDLGAAALRVAQNVDMTVHRTRRTSSLPSGAPST